MPSDLAKEPNTHDAFVVVTLYCRNIAINAWFIAMQSHLAAYTGKTTLLPRPSPGSTSDVDVVQWQVSAGESDWRAVAEQTHATLAKVTADQKLLASLIGINLTYATEKPEPDEATLRSAKTLAAIAGSVDQFVLLDSAPGLSVGYLRLPSLNHNPIETVRVVWGDGDAKSTQSALYGLHAYLVFPDMLVLKAKWLERDVLGDNEVQQLREFESRADGLLNELPATFRCDLPQLTAFLDRALTLNHQLQLVVGTLDTKSDELASQVDNLQWRSRASSGRFNELCLGLEAYVSQSCRRVTAQQRLLASRARTLDSGIRSLQTKLAAMRLETEVLEEKQKHRLELVLAIAGFALALASLVDRDTAKWAIQWATQSTAEPATPLIVLIRLVLISLATLLLSVPAGLYISRKK